MYIEDMGDIEEAELRELDKSVIIRLNRIEATLSAGNICSHDFEELGLQQQVESLTLNISRLEAAISSIELDIHEQ